MSKFQIILTAIFGIFIIVGVGVFALGKFGGGGEAANVTVWGTIPKHTFDTFIKETPLAEDQDVKINYEEHRTESIDADFVDALSKGTGPDLIFLPHDSVLKHQSRITVVPYNSYSARDFKDTYIEEGELFLAPSGVVALPFTVDPLVMYWNRTLFSDAGVTKPPVYWDEFYDLATKLTKREGVSIMQSAVPLGEYGNVSNAKALISALMMQAGTPIVAYRDGKLTNLMLARFNLPALPADRAVSFYTDFSNPTKPAYSWNRSLPPSRDVFLAGDLAVYFGFASELSDLKAKNPNLNFDVAPLPHSRAPGAPNITFGKMTGLAISRSSKNPGAAFLAATKLTSSATLKELTRFSLLPPVRRDLLSVKPTDAYFSVFYDAALRSRGWLEPDPASVGSIFRTMIEAITSGRELISRAISQASGEMDRLLR